LSREFPRFSALLGDLARMAAVHANLKSLLEPGDVLPKAPWEMSPAHT
jgi:hypothetical protein